MKRSPTAQPPCPTGQDSCLNDTLTLNERSRALRARMAETKALPIGHKDRMRNLILEHAEAMQIQAEQEQFSEAVQQRYRGLSDRVYELAKVVIRGPNGHDWQHALSASVKPSELYQRIRALVQYLLTEI